METLIWTIVFITAFACYAWFENKKDDLKLKKINEKLDSVDYQEKMKHGMEALTGQDKLETIAMVSLEKALLYTDSTVARFLLEALGTRYTTETLDAVDELMDVIESKEFREATRKSFSLKANRQKNYYPRIKITYLDELGREKEFRSFELNYTLLKKMRKEITKNIEF